MFHFKRFSLSDERSTMKVGTDSVILGIASKTGSDPKLILDVGTGCGILALMLAQKTNAQIVAIDIDHESCIEANENFKLSPWGNRLSVVETEFSIFAANTNLRFDCIISNPPFFETGYRKKDPRKSKARHCDTLSFHSLFEGSSLLLNPKGFLNIIIPAQSIQSVQTAANAFGLFIQQIKLIHPCIGQRPNRYVCIFAKHNAENIFFDRLTIRYENKFFTEEFKEFVREYYLDFPY